MLILVNGGVKQFAPFLYMQLKLRFILLLFGLLLAVLSNYLIVADADQFKWLIGTMILFGVPHGALDLYIEGKNIYSTEQKDRSILLKYLLNILAYALLWYISPLIALCFFIFITAFHFGEIDWIGKSDSWLHKGAYFIIGLSWIVYFLSVNVQSALKIFVYLGSSNVSEQKWVDLAADVSPVALVTMIFLHVLFIIKANYFYHQSSHAWMAIIQLLVLLFICHYSSLWIGFGFYFGLWHSLLSFDKIRKSFSMPDTIGSWAHLLKQALPFSLMAWVGMLFVMFMFYNSQNATSLVSLLFITLSVLTLPHLQVFTKLKINQVVSKD